MLDQRPAQCHVDHLHAPADAEHRHLALDRAPGERDLAPVALDHGLARLGVSFGAVAGRIDIGPAGKDEAVDAVEEIVWILDQVWIWRDHQRERLGSLNRGDVLVWQQRRAPVPHAPLGLLQRGADADHRSLLVHLSFFSVPRGAVVTRGYPPVGAAALRMTTYASRSAARRILPLAVFGSSAANSTIRGYLYGAVSALTWSWSPTTSSSL